MLRLRGPASQREPLRLHAGEHGGGVAPQVDAAAGGNRGGRRQIVAQRLPGVGSGQLIGHERQVVRDETVEEVRARRLVGAFDGDLPALDADRRGRKIGGDAEPFRQPPGDGGQVPHRQRRVTEPRGLASRRRGLVAVLSPACLAAVHALLQRMLGPGLRGADQRPGHRLAQQRRNQRRNRTAGRAECDLAEQPGERRQPPGRAFHDLQPAVPDVENDSHTGFGLVVEPVEPPRLSRSRPTRPAHRPGTRGEGDRVLDEPPLAGDLEGEQRAVPVDARVVVLFAPAEDLQQHISHCGGVVDPAVHRVLPRRFLGRELVPQWMPRLPRQRPAAVDRVHPVGGRDLADLLGAEHLDGTPVPQDLRPASPPRARRDHPEQPHLSAKGR